MERQPRLLQALDVVTILALAAGTAMVFFYAPMEAVMGLVQKVFYFHVAAGWVGMLSFAVAAVAGIVYLRTTKPTWDIVGVAAVEIGIIFSLINVVTGMIWARPIWNTWWTWDPRLTTATIMLLIYAAYMMLRNGIEDPERRGRFAAVYAIVGFLSVPITFLSIRIFRTIHPVVIGGAGAVPGAEGAFDMTPKMLHTLLFSIVVFSLIFASLLWHRIRMGKLAERVEQMKLNLYQ